MLYVIVMQRKISGCTGRGFELHENNRRISPCTKIRTENYKERQVFHV